MALREKLATSDGPKSSTSGLSGLARSVLSVILRGIRARTAEVPLGEMLLPTPRRAQDVKVYLPKLKSDCPFDIVFWFLPLQGLETLGGMVEYFIQILDFQ